MRRGSHRKRRSTAHNAPSRPGLIRSRRPDTMESKKSKKRFIISEQTQRTTPLPEGAPAPARRRSLPPEKPEAEIARESRTDRFAARDFTGLLGMEGFSDGMLKNHFELYQGYVKNANLILGEIERMTKEDKLDTPPSAQ